MTTDALETVAGDSRGAAFEQLVSPSLLAEAKRVELVTRRKIDTGLVGNYRSAFRGSGLLFADVREYQPGDDVKHIHWKVSARTGKVFVKSYEEDRQLRILLALDISSSTAAGAFNASAFRSRQQRAIECASLLTLLAAKSDDAVGLALFSNRVEEYIPPRKKRLQTQSILLSLMRKRGLTPATDIKAVLSHLHKQERRPLVLFVISDFYSAPFEQELRSLSFKHDVILTLIDQAADQDLVDCGIVEFEDAESGKRTLIDTSNPNCRSAIRKLSESRVQALKAMCERCSVDLLRIRDNPIGPLAELMRLRTSRLR